MARTITITDNLNSLQITRTDTDPSPLSATTNIAKANIVAIDLITTDIVALIEYEERPTIFLDWNFVTVPSVVSGADLYAQIVAMWLNAPASNIFTQTGTFVNADLVAFVLTITHTFNTNNLFLTLKDPLGDVMTAFPANVNPVAPYDVTVDFGGALGAGTYDYTLIAIV